jgi:divalent metal cation (Fe/Co/Zn/Cd) transporter
MDDCCNCCRSAPEPIETLVPERRALIEWALRLEWLTIAWMIVEGAVAILAGIQAGSLTLMAFGLDSVIELGSAVVLLLRLKVELREGRSFPESVERTASKIGGGLLFTLAAYIVAGAIWRLWIGQGEAFS